MHKNCGTCVHCWKSADGSWDCENYENSVGMPVRVNPPHDEACGNWSDNPVDKDKPINSLRHFIDHFWDGE